MGILREDHLTYCNEANCDNPAHKRRNKIKDYRRQDERPVERTQERTPGKAEEKERNKDERQ